MTNYLYYDKGIGEYFVIQAGSRDEADNLAVISNPLTETDQFDVKFIDTIAVLTAEKIAKWIGEY
jgi:hypothetical protein